MDAAEHSEERPAKLRKLNPDHVSCVESKEAKTDEASTNSIEHDMEENNFSKDPDPDHAADDVVPQAVETDDVSSKTGDPTTAPLSKNQQKKLRRKEAYEAVRAERKLKRREKNIEKKARKREEKAALNESGNQAQDGDSAQKQARNEPQPKRRRPVQLPIALIIDCQFDELMTDKELVSLGSQITRCYHDNKNVPFKSHLVVSGWGGRLKERFETVLEGQYKSWKGVRFEDESWIDMGRRMDSIMKTKAGGVLAGALGMEDAVAMRSGTEKANHGDQDQKSQGGDTTQQGTPAVEPARIVYLTSDSPYTLTTLTPNTSYIIGGIVDKNRHKGICYKAAMAAASAADSTVQAKQSTATMNDAKNKPHSTQTRTDDAPAEQTASTLDTEDTHDRSSLPPAHITTARLPISQYMSMQSRKVLTVNHVVEIMLRWLETGDWGSAFLKVIPKRKGGVLLNGAGGGGEDGGDGEGDGDGAGDVGEEEEDEDQDGVGAIGGGKASNGHAQDEDVMEEDEDAVPRTGHEESKHDEA